MGLAVACCLLLGLLSIFATFLPAIHAHTSPDVSAHGHVHGPDCDHDHDHGAAHTADDAAHADDATPTVWSRLPATAAELFHSPVLVVVWIFVFMALVTSLLFTRGILRRPAGLAMHVGALLILGGSMWSSPRGHLLANLWTERHPGLASWIDGDRVPRGVMIVHEGLAENRLLTAETATLPFHVRLQKFRMDYYGPWELHAAVPVLRQAADGRQTVVFEDRTLDWQLDQPLSLPECLLTLTPREFLPRARQTWPDGVPADLWIMGPDVHLCIPTTFGRRASFALPAVAAGAADAANPLLPGPAVMVTVDAFIEDGHTTDPADPTDLALRITLEYSDGPARRMLVTSRHPREDRGVTYVLEPRELEYVADPDGSLPAMDLEFSLPGEPRSMSVRVGQFRDAAGELRGKPLPGLPMKHPPAPGDAGAIHLFFVEPPVKGFFSDVEIIEDGRVVKQATIAVNHPLYYKGYHLHQMDWDKDRHAYTVLSVVSARGLWAVWTGFGLMTLAVFGKYWLAPAVGYFRRRGEGILPARDEGVSPTSRSTGVPPVSRMGVSPMQRGPGSDVPEPAWAATCSHDNASANRRHGRDAHATHGRDARATPEGRG